MLLNLVALVAVLLVSPSLQYRPPLKNLNIVHTWRNLEYDFESEDDYQYAINSGIYSNTSFKRPYDVELHVDKRGHNRIFMTTPKIPSGIPYTLATISSKQGNYGPLLLPYPDFASHSKRDTSSCDRIISVFRIFKDSCDRLWAIDNGRDLTTSPSQICPPKILIFDLKTDKLILNYTVPEGQYIPEKTVHNSIVLDVYDPKPGKCKDVKAYITDSRGFSLLVFDLKTRSSWVIFNDLFQTNENYLETTIEGETFTFPDGLYTSTPSRHRFQCPTCLNASSGAIMNSNAGFIYLHSYASPFEIAAPLDHVNNKSLWIDNPSGNQEVFCPIGYKPSFVATQTIDSKGRIYFGAQNPLSIISWSPNVPYRTENFHRLIENSEILQFVVSLKVRTNSKGEEVLIVVTNRLQKLNTGTISLNEVNFRLMVCRIARLQDGRGHCGYL